MPQMQTLYVQYDYRRAEEASLREVLEVFESEVGGERRPYEWRAGAIDLLTFLQIGLGFVVGVAIKPVIGEYFKGLFKADQLKEAGEKHREALDSWFSQLLGDLKKLLRPIGIYVKNGFPRFTAFNIKEMALALFIPVGDRVFYVVLNNTGMTEGLLATLPSGIIRMLRFAAEKELPEDGKALQLHFDPTTQDWKYLFIPTYRGFGHWIDRYIDLDAGETIPVGSQADFQARFCPRPEDELKFLVSPFRDE